MISALIDLVEASRRETEAIRARLAGTLAELEVARSGDGACPTSNLGMAPMLCKDGKERPCYTPQTRDVLADVQIEGSLSANGAGKVVGRVLGAFSNSPELKKLSYKLLGGCISTMGEAKGSRDMCTRSLMMKAQLSKLEIARDLLPKKNADGT